MRRIIVIASALITGALIVAPALSASGESGSTSLSVSTSSTAPTVHVVRPLVRPLVHHSTLLVSVATRARVSVAQLRSEWQLVAICEVNGNWAMDGPSYSGIGFANTTWLEYGGRRFAPSAGDASRDAQIFIGMRVTGGWVPDQGGCAPGGW